MDRLLLGVDLGGTKGLLGLFEADATRPLLQLRYACADFDGFEPMLARFLDDAAARLGGAVHPAAACIGLAGPVAAGRARMTNLPWTLEAAALRRRFALGPVRLVNDFVAAAAGVDALGPGEIRTLQPGEALAGAPRVIFGPGTGLGVATMFPVGQRWRIAGGEGGHVGLAPCSEIELEFWRWLHRLHQGRVSAERALSGPGLISLYRFLLERDRVDADALLDADDPAAAISSAALAAGADPRGAAALRASAALDLFASMLGAFAGDLALLLLARGGVYIGGGVAPRVLDSRRSACFLEGFLDKGRHTELLAGMPVRLVTEPALGLLGAGAIAAGRASVPALRRRREVAPI